MPQSLKTPFPQATFRRRRPAVLSDSDNPGAADEGVPVGPAPEFWGGGVQGGDARDAEAFGDPGAVRPVDVAWGAEAGLGVVAYLVRACPVYARVEGAGGAGDGRLGPQGSRQAAGARMSSRPRPPPRGQPRGSRGPSRRPARPAGRRTTRRAVPRRPRRRGTQASSPPGCACGRWRRPRRGPRGRRCRTRSRPVLSREPRRRQGCRAPGPARRNNGRSHWTLRPRRTDGRSKGPSTRT